MPVIHVSDQVLRELNELRRQIGIKKFEPYDEVVFRLLHPEEKTRTNQR